MGGRGAFENGANRAMNRSSTALAMGMLASGLHLPVSYALVKWSCAANQRAALVVLAVVAFLITAAGARIAWSCQARLRSRTDANDDAPADRSLFVAQMAMGIDIILALFIAASTVGPLVLSPCA
jgi:hypothetical protein